MKDDKFPYTGPLPEEPWRRLPDESTLWWDRFDRYYRPPGTERRLYRVYTEFLRDRAEDAGASRDSVGLPPGVSGAWRRAYNRYRWAERAAAWDDAQRADRYADERAAVAAMRRRHVQLATGLQTAGGLRLRGLATEKGAKELSTTEARQYVSAGVALERAARGLPEHLIAVGEMDDATLLRRYREVLGEALPVADSGASSESDDFGGGD